jgi:hypothetical protein
VALTFDQGRDGKREDWHENREAPYGLLAGVKELAGRLNEAIEVLEKKLGPVLSPPPTGRDMTPQATSLPNGELTKPPSPLREDASFIERRLDHHIERLYALGERIDL